MQAWLYDISERINALVSVLDEADDKSIEPDVKNALAGIYEGDVPAAVADGIRYIKRQEAQTAEIDAEIKRLQALKRRGKIVLQGCGADMRSLWTLCQLRFLPSFVCTRPAVRLCCR